MKNHEINYFCPFCLGAKFLDTRRAPSKCHQQPLQSTKEISPKRATKNDSQFDNLPISMHPAHSPKTHSTKEIHKSYGFRAAVELQAVLPKHQREQTNCEKQKTAPRTFRSSLKRKPRPTTKTRKGKRARTHAGKA